MSAYRHSGFTLKDDEIRNVLLALIKVYSLEGTNIPLRLPRLTETEQLLMAQIQTMCEWLLGRATATVDETNKEFRNPTPISREVLIRCLKRLVSSVDKWDKYAGSQGYLKYVNQFIV